MFDQYASGDYPHFLGEGAAAAEDSFFHVISVPWEETDPYGGGTSEGPACILEASAQMDTWDGKSNPSHLGIHTYPPVDVQGEAERVMDNIARVTSGVVRKGRFPVLLGGERAITCGAVRGFHEAGITDIGVVQIDAHACLRDSIGGSEYSHLSAMKRVVDDNVPLLQLGVRTCSEEEMRMRDLYGVEYHDADELVLQNINSVRLPPSIPERVYVTLDIDGIDPSFFPSTPIPEPGGLSWYQTINLLESVARQREIVGFDLGQFAPIKGFHAYQVLAAKLVYKMMGIVERSKL